MIESNRNILILEKENIQHEIKKLSTSLALNPTLSIDLEHAKDLLEKYKKIKELLNPNLRISINDY